MGVYVYFIQQGNGSIKIGVSANPESRLKSLQTGNSRRLRLLGAVKFSNRMEAMGVEKELHDKYFNLRCQGEWFRPRILREIKIGGKRLIGGTNKNPCGGVLNVTLEAT